PPRRLKTWSSLGQLGRIPSEYEVVTHNLNYPTRPNRSSALESNPTSPANMWLLTYRDRSPLQADDWLGFRDPDEITYRKYVTMQDEQETAVEVVLDEYGPAQHDASLSGQWAESLAALFTSTRCRCAPPTWGTWHLRPTYPTARCSERGTCCAGCRWWHTGRDSSPTRPVHPSA